MFDFRFFLNFTCHLELQTHKIRKQKTSTTLLENNKFIMHARLNNDMHYTVKLILNYIYFKFCYNLGVS